MPKASFRDNFNNKQVFQPMAAGLKRYRLIFLLLSFLMGCKGGYKFSGISVHPDAKTVSVKYFPAYAPLASPTISQSFTEALKEQLLSQTRLLLADDNTDLSFEGSITGYSTIPVAIQNDPQGDLSALTRLTITVAVKYSNRFEEKNNFEASFSRFADYESNKNFAEIEAALVEEISKQLIQDIFNRALNNW